MNWPLFLKTVTMGLLSLALYVAVFTHQSLVTSFCTRGGGWAVLPILAAFVFSLVHGVFTRNFWRLLGIRARR